MTKYVLDRSELLRHLHEQIQFLEVSGQAFDNDFEGESKRLATTIRVLVHDTKNSKSLLRQLGLKQGLTMVNTSCPTVQGNLAPHSGLVIMRVASPPGVGTSSLTFTLFGAPEPYTDSPAEGPVPSVTYVPRVNGPDPGIEPTLSSFSNWWKQVVIDDAQRRQYTRRDLILAMANKEGGAHVDPKLDQAYAQLTRFNSMERRVKSGSNVLPPDTNLVTARSLSN